MKLYIEHIPYDQYEYGFSGSEAIACEVCGRGFFHKGKTAIIYEVDDKGNRSLVGPACPICSCENPENLRNIMRWQLLELRSKLFELRLRIDAVNLALSHPDEAKPEGKLWYGLNNWIEEETRLLEEAQKLEDYANFSEIVSQATNVVETTGYVYLLGSPEGYCKIGRAKNLSSRLLSIGLQLPFRVELLHSIKVSDPVWAEKYLHQHFAHNRLNGEWFNLTNEEIEWIKSLSSLELRDNKS